MAMPYLARLTHPEVSHSTFLSRRKLLDQEREFSNQNVWLPSDPGWRQSPESFYRLYK